MIDSMDDFSPTQTLLFAVGLTVATVLLAALGKLLFLFAVLAALLVLPTFGAWIWVFFKVVENSGEWVRLAIQLLRRVCRLEARVSSSLPVARARKIRRAL